MGGRGSDTGRAIGLGVAATDADVTDAGLVSAAALVAAPALLVEGTALAATLGTVGLAAIAGDAGVEEAAVDVPADVAGATDVVDGPGAVGFAGRVEAKAGDAAGAVVVPDEADADGDVETGGLEGRDDRAEAELATGVAGSVGVDVTTGAAGAIGFMTAWTEEVGGAATDVLAVDGAGEGPLV